MQIVHVPPHQPWIGIAKRKHGNKTFMIVREGCTPQAAYDTLRAELQTRFPGVGITFIGTRPMRR